MDVPYLRHQILKHKRFLYELYQIKPNSKVLTNATEDNINFALKLLHLITNGRIKLPVNSGDIITRSLRTKKLAAFESNQYLHRMLLSSRPEKLATLRQFHKLYSVLFFYLFNKHQND